MKHAIALLCILVSFCAQAQFNKGDKFIGGNVTMRHTSYDNGNSTNGTFGLSPSFGYFLTKDFAVGAGLGYSYYSYKTYNNGQLNIKQTSHSLSPDIFAKKFFTISEKFFFALAADLSYSGSKDSNNGTSTKFYSFGASITPSFIFFPSTHWGIEASLGDLSFMHSQQRPANGTKSDQFNLNAGTFSLGFAYYLRK